MVDWTSQDGKVAARTEVTNMALSNVRLQRTTDIALAADRVIDRAREDFLRGKDYDPGDFLPPVYVVDALEDLLEAEKIVLFAHVTRTAILDACEKILARA